MPPASKLRSLVPFRAARRAPAVRLFCLPYAGGGAAVYRAWAAALPDAIDVCPVELPGRGFRFREPFAVDMQGLVADLLRGLAPLFDLPVAVFGHSMGASIALELARQAPAAVAHLFASGAPAPHRARAEPGERLGSLTDDTLIAKLRAWGGTPEEVLRHDELMQLALPILRSDLALLDAYAPPLEPKLGAPLSVLAGTADRGVSHDDARAWRDYVEGPFAMHPVPGGHFFLNEPEGRATIFDVLTRSLLP